MVLTLTLLISFVRVDDLWLSKNLECQNYLKRVFTAVLPWQRHNGLSCCAFYDFYAKSKSKTALIFLEIFLIQYHFLEQFIKSLT